MKPELRRAHQELDLAVDRLYARAKFEGDRQRVEHLLGLYEKLVASQSTLKAPVKVRERTLKRKGQVG